MKNKISMFAIIFTCLCLVISSLAIIPVDNNYKSDNIFTFAPVYKNNYFIREHNKVSLSKKSNSRNDLWIKSDENILSYNENSEYINTVEIDFSSIDAISEKQKKKYENSLKYTVYHIYHLLI